ncbi:hypothetical protein [Campylobacter portucalensis]|uniref:hypothetical protein n=1 Tax=Campylobacter portucalensis TaxID=2608384 RepID=UPI0018A6AB56|nr:hypothetical protein [Campylobacter portucalensis]
MENKNFNEKGLNFYDLMIGGIILVSMIAMFIPAIYIRNMIYYISIDIDELQTTHSVLIEENRDLERKINALKFKYEIADPLNIELED